MAHVGLKSQSWQVGFDSELVKLVDVFNIHFGDPLGHVAKAPAGFLAGNEEAAAVDRDVDHLQAALHDDDPVGVGLDALRQCFHRWAARWTSAMRVWDGDFLR
jgi:hypothetical protein